MKGKANNIIPFWKNDLSTFKFLDKTPIAPHAVPHANYQGTMLKQSFNENVPDYIQYYNILGVQHGSVCWLCLEPKEMIPIHRDSFYMLKTKMNVKVEDCVRYLIMLEDWEPGHMVQLDDLVLADWKAGDVWYFDSTVLHWTANCGVTNFYSCQVSTLK